VITKKPTAEPYHFFYIFLLNFQNITSVEQKNYENLFLDFFFELTVAISKMAFLYIFKNGKHLCKTLATRAPIFKNINVKKFLSTN
jgi:hypothetical protein